MYATSMACYTLLEPVLIPRHWPLDCSLLPDALDVPQDIGFRQALTVLTLALFLTL